MSTEWDRLERHTDIVADVVLILFFLTGAAMLVAPMLFENFWLYLIPVCYIIVGIILVKYPRTRRILDVDSEPNQDATVVFIWIAFLYCMLLSAICSLFSQTVRKAFAIALKDIKNEWKGGHGEEQRKTRHCRTGQSAAEPFQG